MEFVLTLPADAPKLAAMIAPLQGRYRVVIKKVRHRRTDAQNRLLWGLIYPTLVEGFKEAWGESLTPDEVHVMMKTEFLSRPIVNRQTGEIVARVWTGSSAALSIQEFSEYVEKISRYAAENLGCVIPTATDQCS